MKVTEFNPEVLFTSADITKLRAIDLDFLKEKSLNNQRKRIRLCAHKGIEDKVHEMIIVHGKDAYVRPHKHIGRSESLHVIEGEAFAFMFTEEGEVSEVVHLGDKNSGLVFYYRISSAVFHNLVIVSDFFVFHEAVQGPFDRSKIIFASWAPQDDDYKEKDIFLGKLRNHIDGRRDSHETICF